MTLIVPSISSYHGTSMWEREDIQVNPYLANTYRSGKIEDERGVSKLFKDATNPIEGRHLYNLIVANHFSSTLEIGFAMGASGAWICQALKDSERERVKEKVYSNISQ